MPSKETTISLNCSPKQGLKIVIKALSQVKDIAEYQYDESALRIIACTSANMKTFGDDIYIEISGSKTKCNVFIQSSTNGQVVDWGRNAQNVENIIAQIQNVVNDRLENKQEDVESKTTKKQKSETPTNVSVDQHAPITNGRTNNHQWIWAVLGGLFALFMILNFNGGITKKITSSLAKADSNNPSYYYGTWSSTNGKIEVTFIGNMTAKCKFILGREPIEYSTEWAVSKDNGVFWGTYYGRGEYNFMTPDGHLYHYNKNGDRYTDEEVYLRKK